MNITLLKKYVKPGDTVYLLRTEENYLGQEAYYIPCKILDMEFDHWSPSYSADEIPRFELKFRLMHIANSSIDYKDVRAGEIYIIHDSNMCGLMAFLRKKEQEVTYTFNYTYDPRNMYDRLVKALPGKYTPIGSFEPDYFDSKKIIFSGNCTIVIWKDGTKTIARCSTWDDFSPEAGLAICFMKHVLGEAKAKKILRNGNKIFESEVEE